MELLRQENSIFWGTKNIKSHAKNSSDAEHLFAQGTTYTQKTQKNQKIAHQKSQARVVLELRTPGPLSRPECVAL